MYIAEVVRRYNLSAPVFLQLDHGGPWLKDSHITMNLSCEDVLDNFLKSLESFVEAEFNVIHIDTTVDLENRDGYANIEKAAIRTTDLILYS